MPTVSTPEKETSLRIQEAPKPVPPSKSLTLRGLGWVRRVPSVDSSGHRGREVDRLGQLQIPLRNAIGAVGRKRKTYGLVAYVDVWMVIEVVCEASTRFTNMMASRKEGKSRFLAREFPERFHPFRLFSHPSIDSSFSLSVI